MLTMESDDLRELPDSYSIAISFWPSGTTPFTDFSSAGDSCHHFKVLRGMVCNMVELEVVCGRRRPARWDGRALPRLLVLMEQILLGLSQHAERTMKT